MKTIIKMFILFLTRTMFGLNTFDVFQFENQKSNAYYFFTEHSLMKYWNGKIEKSHVSINWLLDDECNIIKKGRLNDLP